MADFAYQSYATYEDPRSPLTLPNTFVQTALTYTPGTLVDGDSDNQFETGDSISSPFSLSFQGTVDIGGTLYPVFANNSQVAYVFFDDATIAPGNLVINYNGADYPFCFGAGTAISTPFGSRAVESLRIGDPILSADGRTVPVKWLGTQTARKLFAGPRIQPVRIRAGALGDGLPHSDLTVTADHGMILDGLVINASALVNDDSIDWVPMNELPDRVTYYHVETENHDVILANGAPTETFIDIPGRQAFDNYAEYLELYGAERIIPEMDRMRISSQRLVPDAIKARLGIREAQIDWNAPLTA